MKVPFLDFIQNSILSISFCKYFVSNIFFKKHSVLLSSACFLPSDPYTELEQESHTDRRRGEKLTGCRNVTFTKVFLHYLLPRVSCSQSGSLRTSRCGLDETNTKAPKPLAGWSLGITTGTSSLRKNLASVYVTNVVQQTRDCTTNMNF